MPPWGNLIHWLGLAGLIGAVSWLARIPATAAVRKRDR